MKPLFVFLVLSCYSFSQKSESNFITYSNYANEAEYYFHEGAYDTAAVYFEEAFKFSEVQHPTHQKLFAYALFQLNQRKKAIKILESRTSYMADTIWFPHLTIKEQIKINKRTKVSYKTQEKLLFYRKFIDSIKKVDQIQRIRLNKTMDSLSYIEPYPNRIIDSMKVVIYDDLKTYDSINGKSIIQFTKKYGFPSGKNTGWDHSAAGIILHMPTQWFESNYELLIFELIKGNLEPWMLASGIDRMYALNVGEDKLVSYNRYWTKSIVNPFLMFQNCIALGVSPYYHMNWSTQPEKTIHFHYYKEYKKYYNTTIFYTHNNTYAPLLKSRSE